MRAMGLEGAVRGKKLRTTISDRSVPCPEDRVNRRFWAPRPNALWLSDFTYVSTWTGFVYVAVVIDAFARPIPRARLRRPQARTWLPRQPHGADRLCARLVGAGTRRPPAGRLPGCGPPPRPRGAG